MAARSCVDVVDLDSALGFKHFEGDLEEDEPMGRAGAGNRHRVRRRKSRQLGSFGTRRAAQSAATAFAASEESAPDRATVAYVVER